MNDLLRQIYSGEYEVEGIYKNKNAEYVEADEVFTKLSDQIIELLKSNPNIDAEEMVQEWIDAFYVVTKEELIVAYKKGVAFGFRLAKEIEEI